MSVRQKCSPVGRMSRTQSAATRSGKSSAIRYAQRPPRSCPTTAKRSKPSACMTSDLVLRHGALRIGRVVGRRCRLRTVAVAAQVRADDRVGFGKLRRDPVPHHVRLRMAVKQEERRAAAAMPKVDRRTGCLDAGRGEIFEHPVRLRQSSLLKGSTVEKLHPIHVDHAEIRDLQMRDHGEGEKCDLKKRFRQRDAERLRRIAQRM